MLFELSPFESFRDDCVAKVRRAAEEKGLYVEFGMGSILHRHPMAEKGRRLLAEAGYDTSVSDAQMVIDHLRVAKKLGSPILRCVVGNLFTRDEGHDMAAMADHVVAILHEACPPRKTWASRSPWRATPIYRAGVGLDLARVNSPAFGFTVDCANLAFDLDTPLRLAEIMAPSPDHALQELRVIRSPDGLALENCAWAKATSNWWPSPRCWRSTIRRST